MTLFGWQRLFCRRPNLGSRMNWCAADPRNLVCRAARLASAGCCMAVTAWKNRSYRENERMKVSDVKASRRGPIWRSRCLPAQSLISSGTNAPASLPPCRSTACSSAETQGRPTRAGGVNAPVLRASTPHGMMPCRFDLKMERRHVVEEAGVRRHDRDRHRCLKSGWPHAQESLQRILRFAGRSAR